MSEEKDDQKIEYKAEDEDNLKSVDLVERMKKLKEQLKQCQKEKAEYLAGWQRSQADFINYRRRQEEQMGEWLNMAEEKIIREILPVLDTFHARKMYMQAGEEAGLWKNKNTDGADVIINQLTSILKRIGLEEMKTIGEKFNPEYHEPVEQVIKDGLESVIIEEVQKGYLFNGKVIRVAKVKVAKN